MYTNLLVPQALESPLEARSPEVPSSLVVLQSYPNPFNPTTVIRYELPEVGRVSLKVYDLLGREVAVLVNEPKAAGIYTATWNASDLPSGTYICRLVSVDGGGKGVTKSVKMQYVR